MVPPDPVRCLALLSQLHARLGAAGFGRALQTLLGLTLQDAGFRVLRNAVGVPDLVASRPDGGNGFAFEVKTGEGAITLSERDLDGVRSTGHRPVVAALLFPDPRPRWLVVDASTLVPGMHPQLRLARRSQVDLGFDLDAAFRTALGVYHPRAMLGSEALDLVFFERSPRP